MKTILCLCILCLFPFLGLLAESKLPVCDLGAEMFTFEILNQIDAHTVRVKITGRVKNLGANDFSARPKQTIAVLSEGSPEPGGVFTEVQRGEILSLPVGEFFDLVYERDWKIADLDSFNGLPYFRLELRYAPEILTDNQPENDDMVAKNNKRERTTKQLRRIWAVYSKK